MARSNRSAVNQYKGRKAARLRGEPMKSRQGEGAPWYTWRTPGICKIEIADPIQALERSLTKFGEVAAYRERFAAERAVEREAERTAHRLAAFAEAEVAEGQVSKEAGLVRALVKRGGNRNVLPRGPLPKFPDLSTPQI